MKRLWSKIKTYISPFLNWRILVIYVPIWFLMSGWTYLFIFLGTKHHITWMLTAGTFWATVLWLPMTPEKLLTIPLTLLIYYRWKGQIDEKLAAMVVEAKQDWNNTKAWFRRNHYKLVRTLIVLLGATIVLILGLILMG